MAAGKKPRLTAKLRRAPTQYEPKARLAAGGMAEVWRGDAVFEDGGRHPVAIKRVLPELAAQPVYRSMFEDEARLGMMLMHREVMAKSEAPHNKGITWEKYKEFRTYTTCAANRRTPES